MRYAVLFFFWWYAIAFLVAVGSIAVDDYPRERKDTGLGDDIAKAFICLGGAVILGLVLWA